MQKTGLLCLNFLISSHSNMLCSGVRKARTLHSISQKANVNNLGCGSLIIHPQVTTSHHPAPARRQSLLLWLVLFASLGCALKSNIAIRKPQTLMLTAESRVGKQLLDLLIQLFFLSLLNSQNPALSSRV